MIKKGPKTHAEYRTESALIPGAREPVPEDLEPAAAVFWEAIVIRLPADWFTSETIPLLKAYCRHSAFADQFAGEIIGVRKEIARVEAGIAKGRTGKRVLPKLKESLYALHKMHGYETDHATSCATKLRLTNQSRFVKETAASKARSAPNAAPPPWHDWGEHATNKPI